MPCKRAKRGRVRLYSDSIFAFFCLRKGLALPNESTHLINYAIVRNALQKRCEMRPKVQNLFIKMYRIETNFIRITFEIGVNIDY